jgi:hypothetical protein
MVDLEEIITLELLQAEEHILVAMGVQTEELVLEFLEILVVAVAVQ